MSKPTKQPVKAQAQAKVEAKVETPKAQWADDSLVYTCQNVESGCVGILREADEDEGVEQALVDVCKEAVVCANVCASHFTYGDEASLAERIGACNDMAECCEALLKALGDDTKYEYLEACTKACLEQCQKTAGTEEEEKDGPAHPEGAEEPATETVTSKSNAKPVAAKPRRNPKWLTVIAKADGPVHMVINGLIGESVLDDTGTSSKEFRNALDKIPAGNPIHLHINSEGGSVADGLEMYNTLKARSADVTVHIDGVALSCASLVALAGDTVISPKSSVWMIHAPRLTTYGDSAEHQKSIDMLDAFAKTMCAVYAEETAHDEDEIMALMKAETWMTGEEAVAFGLADVMEAETDTEAPIEQDDQDTEDQDQEEDAEARARRLVIAALDPAKFKLPDSVKAIINSISTCSSVGSEAGNAASNSNKSKTMKEDTKTPVAAAQPAASNADLSVLVNKERKARITAEVKRRAEAKVANAQLPWWIDRALEDEDAVYAQLDAMPTAAAPGGEPIEHEVGAIFSAESGQKSQRLDAVAAIKKLATPEARVQALRSQWTPLMQESLKRDMRAMRSGLPVAANTYSSSLVTDFLVDQAITVLQNRWAALEAFTRDFSVSRLQEYSTAQVKIVASGASLLRGTKGSPITSFAPNGATVNAAAVPVTHYSVPFGVSQEELMQGLRLENLTNINLAVLADGLIADALGVTKSTVFSAGTLIATSGTFGWTSEMPTLWGYLKKSPLKNALLDGAYYAKLINQPGFYQAALLGERGGGRAATFGWDVLEENTQWAGAEKNTVGFVCNPQAIAAVAGLPQTPPNIPGATLQEAVVTIPGPDISIAAYTWLDLATRTLACSFDVMAGFSVGDATAGALLKSA